jgi:hypothetical protein
MNSPRKKLAEELDRIAARYESQFAGMPRSSRNVDELDAILADTRSVLARIESIPEAVRPPELGALAETVRSNVALYERERTLILDAARIGPEYERFAGLATTANLVFARYRRHFAGQSRTTRDLGLLDEMIDDLESTEEGMAEVVSEAKKAPELARDLELVRSTLKLYREEREQILHARDEGTPEERASLLAQLANGQFRLYQMHFAGKARATRRPALLLRMLDQLGKILAAMQALARGGLKGGNNADNIAVVERQIDTYKKELDAIRESRKGISFGDLLGMLGGAANDVFEAFRAEYAGKDRKTRDLDALSVHCDELGDIRRQMVDMGRAEPSASNESNIDIVSTQLMSFEQEWDQITLAKK